MELTRLRKGHGPRIRHCWIVVVRFRPGRKCLPTAAPSKDPF